MKKKYYILIIITFLISIIIIINYIDDIEKNKRIETKKEYFNNFDLFIKGTICNIEQQYDTHKYLITLNVLQSNYENYSKEALGAIFCLKIENTAVFADHHKGYEINDYVYIGLDQQPLIICKDINGNMKFTKKKDEMMLYYIAPSLKRMNELVKIGCNDVD